MDQLIQEYTDRIQHLKEDRDEWRRTAIASTLRARTLVIFGAVVVGAMVVLSIVGMLALGNLNDIARAQKTTIQAADRADCRSRIAAEQNAIVRERDALGWQALSAVANGLDAADFLSARQALDAANYRVAQLPNLQDEVDKRCRKVTR